MLKEKLQQIKDGNTNLYDHLTNVLTKILLDNPKNAFELFEDYSLQVKQSGYVFQKHQEYDNASRPIAQLDPEIAKQTLKLIGKINLGTEDEPQDPPQAGYVPNLPEEAVLFEWAGLAIDETYKIFKSLTLLSVTKQASQVRLWGKILGRNKDYFIAEGVAGTNVEDGELPPDVEARGSGVNTKSYWATTDILSNDWIELPLVYPQHITTARQIRYIFTGNLEADVITNPYFFGKEKHLLKAQIVRITQSTQIAPKGQFTLREDDIKEIDPTQDYKLPPFNQLITLDSWVHKTQAILKCGRLTIQLPADLGDKDPEVEQKLMEAADPQEPRLKPLSQDRILGRRGWKIRICGDTTDYNPQAKDVKNKQNNGVIVIKSNTWPGLVSVYQNKVFQQMYVGYGFKLSDQHFYPKQPQLVQNEAVDVPEQPEPNFPAEVPQQPID
ncbi:hypothetical protein pb186bvf_009884 [Paramecium bursaria]